MTYKTLDELTELKYKMDMARIPEADRAVVLDKDVWKDQLQRMQYHMPFERAVESTSQIMGFRIIWRERIVTTTTKYSTRG